MQPRKQSRWYLDGALGYSNTPPFTLFKSDNDSSYVPTDLRGLRAPHLVERLQDQAQSMLGEYCRSHYPDQQVRFGKLLLMLPSLRSVGPKMIEDLFFRGTLDNVPIERMLCDMFKSS